MKREEVKERKGNEKETGDEMIRIENRRGERRNLEEMAKRG